MLRCTETTPSNLLRRTRWKWQEIILLLFQVFSHSPLELDDQINLLQHQPVQRKSSEVWCHKLKPDQMGRENGAVAYWQNICFACANARFRPWNPFLDEETACMDGSHISFHKRGIGGSLGSFQVKKMKWRGCEPPVLMDHHPDPNWICA